MDEERSASQASWRARINTRERHDKKDCPAWVKPADRERWVQKGLIICQEETQRMIRLSATHALRILDHLRRRRTGRARNRDWRTRHLHLAGWT